jgi:hypothetical protein
MRMMDIYLLLPPLVAIVAAVLVVIATRRSMARLKRAAAEDAKSIEIDLPGSETPHDPTGGARPRALAEGSSSSKRRMAI